VLQRLPILLKIVVLHGLLVAGTMGKMAKARTAKARMALFCPVYSQDFLLKSGANW
jgi:hypothetical protein